MTAIELASLLRMNGPTWAQTFHDSQVLRGITHAREKLKLEAYVQIPDEFVVSVVSETAKFLNRLDPNLMAECLDKDYGGQEG